MENSEMNSDINYSIEPARNSYFRALVDLFVTPSRAFISIAIKPRWFLPFILCVIATLTYEILTHSQQLNDMIENLRSNTTLSADEIQNRIDNLEWQKSYGVVWKEVPKGLGLLTLFHSFKLFGLALIVWLALQLYLAKTGYLSVLSMCSFAYMVVIPEVLLKVPLVIVKGTREVHLSLAVLLPPDWDGSMLFNLFEELNIFSIWMVVLLGIALPIVTGISQKKARTMVGCLWGAWLLWSLLAGNLIQLT